MNKLVIENDLFYPGKSGKSQGRWLLWRGWGVPRRVV